MHSCSRSSGTQEGRDRKERSGPIIATGCSDGYVCIFAAYSGAVLLRVQLYVGPARCVAYAPNGKTLAAGCHGHVCTLDANSGTVHLRMPVPKGLLHECALQDELARRMRRHLQLSVQVSWVAAMAHMATHGLDGRGSLFSDSFFSVESVVSLLFLHGMSVYSCTCP